MRSCCAIGLLLVGSFFGYGFSVELRCYCNLPDCVHTAYMCKSELGCFQELPYGPDSTNRSPTIGCLELWSPQRPFHCVGLKSVAQSSPGWSTSTTTTTLRPFNSGKKEISFLRCCLEDMCNYVPQSQPELNISVLKTDQQVSISVEGSNQLKKWSVQRKEENVSERVWFRVAVIAVPVCGGIILLILISLACILLKSDWRKVSDNDRLLPVRNASESAAPPDSALNQPKHHKLLYASIPAYKLLKGQQRHYHSDSTLVVCSEKTTDRPNTVFLAV